MNPLASRKQLLIAESEINRAQLLHDWRNLAGELGALADRAKSFNTLAGSVMPLVAGLASFTGGKFAPVATATSWLQKISSGVRLASTLWLMFRSRGNDSASKPSRQGDDAA